MKKSREINDTNLREREEMKLGKGSQGTLHVLVILLSARVAGKKVSIFTHLYSMHITDCVAQITWLIIF